MILAVIRETQDILGLPTSSQTGGVHVTPWHTQKTKLMAPDVPLALRTFFFSSLNYELVTNIKLQIEPQNIQYSNFSRKTNKQTKDNNV